MVKIDEETRKQFQRRAQSGWKSTQVSSYKPQSLGTSNVKQGGGILGYASILDPPRSRPFIRGYRLGRYYSPLRYFQYARQALEPPQQSNTDKYDRQVLDAQHYTQYLARLMLSLRRRGMSRGLQVQQLLQYAQMAKTQRSRYRFLRLLQNYAFRKPTGELTYNPIFQSYNERKTFFKSTPHPWNLVDPTFREEMIFRERREARARRDFYISQGRNLERLSRLWPDPKSPPSPETTALYGGRWVVIKVVQISKTLQKIWQRHTKSGEIRTFVKRNHKPLAKHNFKRSQRHRNGYYPNRMYRRRFY